MPLVLMLLLLLIVMVMVGVGVGVGVSVVMVVLLMRSHRRVPVTVHRNLDRLCLWLPMLICLALERAVSRERESNLALPVSPFLSLSVSVSSPPFFSSLCVCMCMYVIVHLYKSHYSFKPC